MAKKKLTIEYDQIGDILYISKRKPYAAQESEEIADGVVVRMNPKTGEVENVEILFFSTLLKGKGKFELPVDAELRVAAS
jgi:uncharacterized protein YuzE